MAAKQPQPSWLAEEAGGLIIGPLFVVSPPAESHIIPPTVRSGAGLPESQRIAVRADGLIAP